MSQKRQIDSGKHSLSKKNRKSTPSVAERIRNVVQKWKQELDTIDNLEPSSISISFLSKDVYINGKFDHRKNLADIDFTKDSADWTETDGRIDFQPNTKPVEITYSSDSDRETCHDFLEGDELYGLTVPKKYVLTSLNQVYAKVDEFLKLDWGTIVLHFSIDEDDDTQEIWITNQ